MQYVKAMTATLSNPDNKNHKAADPKKIENGATQTSVAVATILFSMAMARLAL